MKDKAFEEACRVWRAKQRRVRKQALDEAERAIYEENKEVIDIAKKAAFILAFMSRVYPSACFLNIGDILCKVESYDELNFYYYWCCRRLA